MDGPSFSIHFVYVLSWPKSKQKWIEFSSDLVDQSGWKIMGFCKVLAGFLFIVMATIYWNFPRALLACFFYVKSFLRAFFCFWGYREFGLLVFSSPEALLFSVWAAQNEFNLGALMLMGSSSQERSLIVTQYKKKERAASRVECESNCLALWPCRWWGLYGYQFQCF